MRDRLVRNMRRFKFSSHFSGMGGLELICFIIHYWLQRLLGKNAFPRPVSQHSCDMAGHCRRTLESFSEPWRPQHVARDILHRIPVKDLQKMEKELPKPSDLKEAQRRQFDKIKVMANEFFDNLTAAPVCAECDLHCANGQHCDLFSSGIAEDDDVHCAGGYGAHSSLTLNGSGVVCKNVSRIGSRTGDTGSGAMSQIV